MFKTQLFLLVVIIACSCKEQKPPPSISFYHWKSYLDINPLEARYLDQLNTDKLYIRYFDVDVQKGETKPIGKIINQHPSPLPYNIIPTIFITNRTFQQIEGKEIQNLAEKVISLIQEKHTGISESVIQEVQFDCDWSQATKEKFFYFLKEIKKQTAWQLSATIRLHQVKFKDKTGVPPVDRFVLMCYNTGNLKEMSEENSILNPEVVELYIDGKVNYPHRLELALPLFSWGVLFREGKLIKLIRNVDASYFKDSDKFQLEGNKVEVLKSTYLNGYYLYEGDILRLEQVDMETLVSTVKILRTHIQPEEIIFYHLDSIVIKTFDYESLENIRHQFVGG